VAYHKSAEKRAKRNDRVRKENKKYISSVRTAIKKFRTAAQTALTGGDTSVLVPLFQEAQSQLAKAAQKGLVHSNNAGRRIGRLAALLKTAAAGAPAKTETAKAPKAKAKTKTTTTAAKKPTAAKKTTKKKASKK